MKSKYMYFIFISLKIRYNAWEEVKEAIEVVGEVVVSAVMAVFPMKRRHEYNLVRQLMKM